MLPWTGTIYPNVAAPPAGNRWLFEAFSWKPATPFRETLRVARFERGRSAADFILIDAAGREYTMRANLLLDALEHVNVYGGWINAEWSFNKRGANYSLIFVGS